MVVSDSTLEACNAVPESANSALGSVSEAPHAAASASPVDIVYAHVDAI